MFEIGSCSKICKDLGFTDEINVLVVIHDSEYLGAPGNLLESCSYKVTKAGNAVAALSILSDGNFDLVLVDIGLIDFDAFKLIKIIAKMNQQAMLLSPSDDDALRSKALESGASMLVKRPLQADVLRHIQQIVLRQRVPMSNKYDEGKDMDCEIIGESGSQLKGKAPVATTADNGKQIMEEEENQNGFLPRKAKRYRKRSNRDQECDPMPENNYNGTNTKVRNAPIIWTQELHNRFLEAVDHLGEGGCYPRDILNHMSVNGLSRWQVASHLQKCRNNTWRPPEERKSSSSSLSNTDQKSVEEGSQSDHPSEKRRRRKVSIPRERPKRFGRCPAIGLKSESAVHKGSQSISNTNNGAGANGNANDNYTTLERSKLQDYDQIFSDLGSDFSKNGRRQDGQPVENHQQEPGINEGAQTMDMSNNIDIADYENSNDNFTIILERTESADQYYNPIISDLGELILPKSYHSSSLTNDQKQTHDDFHDFLSGMDDFYPNMIESRLPEESVALNQNYLSQYSLFDLNNISSHDQHPSEPDRDKNGESAGASPSHFL